MESNIRPTEEEVKMRIANFRAAAKPYFDVLEQMVLREQPNFVMNPETKEVTRVEHSSPGKARILESIYMIADKYAVDRNTAALMV